MMRHYHAAAAEDEELAQPSNVEVAGEHEPRSEGSLSTLTALLLWGGGLGLLLTADALLQTAGRALHITFPSALIGGLPTILITCSVAVLVVFKALCERA